MTPPHKPWFKSMIYLEIFLQLPYFVVGFYAFVGGEALWIVGGKGMTCAPHVHTPPKGALDRQKSLQA